MTTSLRTYMLAMAAPAWALSLMLLGLAPAAPGDPVLAAMLVGLGVWEGRGSPSS